MLPNPRNSFGALVAFLPAIAVAQVSTETVSFQQGVGGYTGTANISISDCTTGQVADYLDGSLSANYKFEIDGHGDPPVTGSWDRDGLFRFDNIIGDAPGQIPPNSTVISARIELFTSTEANAESPGIIGVAKLLKPFDSSTRWTDPFGTSGPDYAGGDFDRPVGGFEGCAKGSIQATDVSPIVQAWVNGEANYGFITMIALNSNAWMCGTSGNADPARRPKLVVTFTRSRSRTFTFQQGVNSYTGASMLHMQASGATTLGSTITAGQYLDGGTSTKDALIKFDNIFGTDANQVAPEATILKAYMTLTTISQANDADARSRGRYDVHRLLLAVDWAGDGGEPFLWGDFVGGAGPTEANGEIGPTLVSAEGIYWDARVPLDVTSTVQAWQSGAPNYGLILTPGTHDGSSSTDLAGPTADGWKIYFTGSSTASRRPQLVVVVMSNSSDFDHNGYVDTTDFRDYLIPCVSGPSIPYASGCGYADLDNDFDVDMDDFGLWQACFSGTALASSDCR